MLDSHSPVFQQNTASSKLQQSNPSHDVEFHAQ